MPAAIPSPPEAVDAVARESLRELTAGGRVRISSLAGAGPTEVGISTPHPVYNLGLRDVVDDHPPSEDSDTGWRYLVDVGAGPVAAAEIATTAESTEPRFASLNQGPFVVATVEALPLAEAGGGPGQYSMRLLRIPALYVLALWLHAEDQGEDVFIPLSPAPDSLDPGNEYTWGEFRERLLPAAQQKLEFDDTPQQY